MSHVDQWRSFLSSERELSKLIEDKARQLLFFPELDGVVLGVDTLLAFSDSALVQLIGVVDGQFEIAPKYFENRLLLARAICLLVSEQSSYWYERWLVGDFDGLFFLTIGDVKVDDLPENSKERLCKQSMRMVAKLTGPFLYGRIGDG